MGEETRAEAQSGSRLLVLTSAMGRAASPSCSPLSLPPCPLQPHPRHCSPDGSN